MCQRQIMTVSVVRGVTRLAVDSVRAEQNEGVDEKRSGQVVVPRFPTDTPNTFALSIRLWFLICVRRRYLHSRSSLPVPIRYRGTQQAENGATAPPFLPSPSATRTPLQPSPQQRPPPPRTIGATQRWHSRHHNQPTPEDRENEGPTEMQQDRPLLHPPVPIAAPTKVGHRVGGCTDGGLSTRLG